MKNLHRFAAGIFVVLCLSLLAGCGGRSDSGSNSTTSPPSSNWDSMVWDQGNWS